MRVGSERWWERVSPRVRDAIVRGRIGDVRAAELTATEDMLRSEAASNYQPKDDKLSDIVAAGSDGLLDLNGGVISIRKVGADTGSSVISRDDGDARFAAVAHDHDGSYAPLYHPQNDAADVVPDGSAWGEVLVGASGARNVQEVLDHIDSNLRSVLPFGATLTFWAGNAATWTSMPAAHTIFLANVQSLRRLDLTNFTQARFTAVKIAAAASGATLRMRYATSFPGTTIGNFTQMGDSSTEIAVSLSTSATAEGPTSGWISLVSGARSDVWVGITGINGNGSASPAFTSLCAEFR